MNKWMEGYSSDVEYISNYYKELTPNQLNLTALLNGIDPIDTNRAFNYCELGCGQGATILVLASLYPQGKFWAVDYNPSHIAKAKKIAKEAELTNIYFLENSFQDLIDDSNILPSVEFMVFHGIYTWVNDKNRANLVELCKRHVLSGGFVYNSYNSKPGWSDGEVLQKLIFGLSKESKGNSIDKIGDVINRLDNIKSIKSGFLKNNEKTMIAKIDELKDKDRNYLAHEYLHDDWKAFYFSEVSKDMADAKLTYLAQATPAEIYMLDLLPQNVQKQLSTMNILENRELLVDITINRSFRKDLYIRGNSGRVTPSKQLDWFLDKEWVLLNHDDIEEFTFSLPMGKVDGDKKIYTMIIYHLKEGVLTTQELLERTSLNPMGMIQALTLLSHANYIALYDNYTNSNISQLNKIFVENALGDGNIKYAIASHIKSAVSLNNINITFLDGLYKGINGRKELVEYVYTKFNKYGLSIVYENRVLSGDDMKKRVYQLEKIWRRDLLPFWQEIGLVDRE